MLTLGSMWAGVAAGWGAAGRSAAGTASSVEGRADKGTIQRRHLFQASSPQGEQQSPGQNASLPQVPSKTLSCLARCFMFREVRALGEL